MTMYMCEIEQMGCDGRSDDYMLFTLNEAQYKKLVAFINKDLNE